MPYILVALALLAAFLVIAPLISRASASQMQSLVKGTVAGASFLLAGFLALRGLLPVAIPIFLLGLGVLRLRARPGGGYSWGGKSAGQKSSVKTSMLVMYLEHDSGDMDGQVLAGQFEGQKLSAMATADLLAFRDECASAGDQSLQLIEAFLDRLHSGWRDEAGGAAQGGARPAPGGDGQMSRDEAYNVLGLDRQASAKDIRDAHRKMMNRYHPDHGGSDYLAAKINQAKDVLLAKD